MKLIQHEVKPSALLASRPCVKYFISCIAQASAIVQLAILRNFLKKHFVINMFTGSL